MRRKNSSYLPAPPAPAYEVKRTSRSVLRLRCVERTVLGSASSDIPVKLVVFDFDECLTLVTLMSEDGEYTDEQEFWAREVNFETPWVSGSRIDKLRKLFDDLRCGKKGEKRTLACLTRNGNANGVDAVLNLLRVAGLDHYFSAVWALPYKLGRSCGAFLHEGQWKSFEPPVRRLISDHKADALHHLVAHPQDWFPQLLGKAEDVACLVGGLKLAEVVLVDDQRANFQSPSGAQVLRYCKVARYDAPYRDFGLMRDMGGMGAHDEWDYDMLKRFVEDPWMCKETYQVRCQERDFEGHDRQAPVSLVIFDFDETLTMATFMPTDRGFAEGAGWRPPKDDEWSEAELIEYNFESPYISGSRVDKLREMLLSLTETPGGKRRTLAILTKNDLGVFAVLNLLLLAGLADFFSAIWTLPMATRPKIPNGMYRTASGEWASFEPPMADVHEHKADVIHHIVDHVAAWFPQLGDAYGEAVDGPQQALRRLTLEGVALVDDERANFRSDCETQAKVLRYCKVARYDEVYRDCRLLNQMGGIGAHSDADYATLKAFVERPWEYPYESSTRVPFEAAPSTRSTATSMALPSMKKTDSAKSLCRDSAASEREPEKVPRVRRNSKQDGVASSRSRSPAPPDVQVQSGHDAVAGHGHGHPTIGSCATS